MNLSFAGWEYGFIVPFALATLAFAAFSWRRSIHTTAGQFKHSVIFYGAGLAPVILFAVVAVLTGDKSNNWTFEQAHKAVALAVGALVALYCPFAVVALASSVRQWQSPLAYSAVLASVLVPLLAITPFLVAASAVMSCALLQVQQCL